MTDPILPSTATPPREVDRLQYRGNKFPVILYPFYVVFALFALWYLARYAWPDLALWMKKL